MSLGTRATCFVRRVGGAGAGVKEAQLKAAGFEAISRAKDGGLIASKPWPGNMDTWTHSRHGASGNAVSLDTAVGPPKRVRWVAAAMEEVVDPKGFIGDVRGNGGGTREPLRALGGYLIGPKEPAVVGNIAQYRLSPRFDEDHLEARYMQRFLHYSQ